MGPRVLTGSIRVFRLSTPGSTVDARSFQDPRAYQPMAAQPGGPAPNSGFRVEGLGVEGLSGGSRGLGFAKP